MCSSDLTLCFKKHLKGQTMKKEIKTLNDLVDYYRTTAQFLSLRMRTQKDYDYCIKRVVEALFSPNVTMGRSILDRERVVEGKGVGHCC